MNFGRVKMGVGQVDVNNPAYRHGHSGSAGQSPTYVSWAAMIQRCTNHNLMHSARYVERGICVCERWMSFENFLSDMGERPEGTTLDRKNNDLGYDKDNCRWATHEVQANNKSSNRRVTLSGRTLSVTQWCKELGLSKNTVWARIHKWGYTPEAALTAPKQDRSKAAVRMTAIRLTRVKD